MSEKVQTSMVRWEGVESGLEEKKALEGGREGQGRGGTSGASYLQQEPDFPPAYATDPQGLVQRVGGVCGDDQEGEECDEEEAVARTKRHHDGGGWWEGGRAYIQAQGGGGMVRVPSLSLSVCACACACAYVSGCRGGGVGKARRKGSSQRRIRRRAVSYTDPPFPNPLKLLN